MVIATLVTEVLLVEAVQCQLEQPAVSCYYQQEEDEQVEAVSGGQEVVSLDEAHPVVITLEVQASHRS